MNQEITLLERDHAYFHELNLDHDQKPNYMEFDYLPRKCEANGAFFHTSKLSHSPFSFLFLISSFRYDSNNQHLVLIKISWSFVLFGLIERKSHVHVEGKKVPIKQDLLIKDNEKERGHRLLCVHENRSIYDLYIYLYISYIKIKKKPFELFNYEILLSQGELLGFQLLLLTLLGRKLKV